MFVCLTLKFLLELAREKNSQPLPPVGEKFGVRLPPERYCLLANNYQLVKNQGKGQPSRVSVLLGWHILFEEW